jgi:two-component system, cell cycle sensor histidine kinase and response regulator CckA
MAAVPPHELERLDALACCRIVGTRPEPEFDELARLAALLTDSPLAMISLVDRASLWVKAAHGFAPGAYPREHAPCEVAIRGAGYFELRDLSADARFSACALSAAAGARAYAAVPVHDGAHALGTLAVMAPTPQTWSAAQRDTLAALARQVSALLELRRLRDRRLLRSEALLSSATRISGVGCWQWNLVTGEITWTDEMYVIFGLDRSVTPSLSLFSAHLHPDDRDTISARTKLAMQGELTDFPDYRIVRPDGAVRVVHASAEVERDRDGSALRLTGALHDVTAQRAAEEQRKQVAVSAMQTQKLESLGVLSAGVAHDFNNLLVGVLGNAELALADRSLSPTTSDLVERIVEAAQRAGALTRQLLAYTGRSHLKFIELDLSAQVSALLERMRGSLSPRVSVETSLPGGLPAIRADLDQLQLLTGNLLLNAAEAYDDGEGEVVLRTFLATIDSDEQHDLSVPAQLTHGRYVVLEVSDLGCGMAQDTLERALEPFFSTKFTGRGLGLSAVLGIARSHQGVLTVDSRPNQGSRVRLHFPALDRAASSAARGAPANTRGGQFAGRTVLLVDDERLVRNVERLAMQRAGLSVIEAEDGQQAIELLARHVDVVDLVVLDLMMPGLDAATTLRALRAHRPDLPVIVQSGYPEEEVSRNLDELDGRLEFLQKPFTVQAMLSKVAALLPAHKEPRTVDKD